MRRVRAGREEEGGREGEGEGEMKEGGGHVVKQ